MFKTPEGAWTRVDYPLTKAALLILRKQWPKALTFHSLFNHARQLIGQDGPEDVDPIHQQEELLAEDLLFCFVGNVVELHTCRQDFAAQLSERPKASPLGVYQARTGLPIVNLRHETVELDLPSRYLLTAMDGKKNMDDLADYLSGLEQLGILTVKDHESPTGSHTHTDVIREKAEELAQNLADLALLIG